MTHDTTCSATAAPRAASLARRVAAMLYDLILLAAVWWSIGLLAVAIAGGEEIRAPANHVLTLVLLSASYLYFVIPWSRSGQTLGMKCWRLMLSRADGQRVDVRTASIRFAAACLALLPLGIGVIWSLVDRDRLAWHDRLSGSRLHLQIPHH